MFYKITVTEENYEKLQEFYSSNGYDCYGFSRDDIELDAYLIIKTTEYGNSLLYENYDGDWDRVELVFDCDEFYDSYTECEDCGDYVLNEDSYCVNEGTRYERLVCGYCLDDYTCCDCCGEYYDDDNMQSDDYDNHVCDRCYDRHGYATCYECGRIDTDLIWDDEEGEYFCERCCPERAIHAYSYKPTPIFYKGHHETTEVPLLFMGVELEVDDGDNIECLADWETDRLYCKQDGSLSSEGFECVSHPHTLAAHKEFCWKDTIDIMLNNGFTSHNAGSCGLHVHVNKDFFGDEHELNAAKLIIIVSRFWNSFIIPFTRRTKTQLARWAMPPSENHIINKDDTEEARRTKIYNASCGRYRAINLCNYHTIEFRMFRGTLKFSTFMATLEFVDGICRYVKNHTLEEVIDASAKEIFGAEEFSNTEYYFDYLSERNINLDNINDNQDEPVNVEYTE